MKISFVHDLSVSQSMGGAQLSNIEVIREGERRGHEINVINRRDYKFRYLEGSDLVILSTLRGFDKKFIKYISEKYPFIRYEHDYVCVSAGKAYQGMTKECMLSNHRCERCPYNFYKELFEKSILNIFLSPLHRDKHFLAFGNIIEPNYCFPSPVVVERFYPDVGRRRIKGSYLYVGSIAKHKGMDTIAAFIRKNPKSVFTMVGELRKECEYLKELPNCNLVPGVSQAKLSKFYSAAEKFLHFPLWDEPFGRTVMEAYLSGCEIITNHRVGAMSYGWDLSKMDEIREIIRNSPKKLWERIEKAISEPRLP